MLLKSADDRAPDIAALEGLRARPGLDQRTRRAIEDEIWSIRLGAKAEGDAAYQLDFDLERTRNWAVIHDLRLDIDGQVAQIDHLVISRMLEIFVCESKSFTGGVNVNEHGEWTTFRDRTPIGIPSPVEQNRRHIAVLEQAIKLGLVNLPRRVVAIRPRCLNIVLISKDGAINRPRTKLPELDSVVKVDQFRTHLLKREFSSFEMLKLIAGDTLERFGRQLVALHQPQRIDWARRFGLMATSLAKPSAAPRPIDASSPRKPSGLLCASCAIEVSTAEVFYCRLHKARFDGHIYCIPCQQRVTGTGHA